jgi:hypothetical protein
MTEGNVELARRMIKAFNERDVDAIAARITEDFEFMPYLATQVETTTYRAGPGSASTWRMRTRPGTRS